MIINKVKQNYLPQNHPSFKAARPSSVISFYKNVDPQKFSVQFSKTFGIHTDFKQNRAVATGSSLTANIFESLSKRFNILKDTMPSSLRVYDDSDLLLTKLKDCEGLCTFESVKVLRNEPIFKLRSIFYNNKNTTLVDFEEIAENAYNRGHFSTNSFLHTFIHEWSHNVHYDNLYKAFGYDGLCPWALARYNPKGFDPNPHVSGIWQAGLLTRKKFNDREAEIIKQYISDYAGGVITKSGEKIGGDPFELVAENMTKRIVDSLDKNTLLPRYNPFVKGKSESAELETLIENAWRGMLWI